MVVQKKRSLPKTETQFIKTVWSFYRQQGRHDLSWRKTNDPYKILVSEIMLQQTQVTRVLPKYKAFLKQFPTTKKLAEASLGEVLVAWQGLGYNRRAKFLKQAAEAVMGEHKGKWPKILPELRALPGIGSYTAGAVVNFAYNEPVPLIETNVRTVYIHHFFHDKEGVSDTELLPIIERTLDTKNPREWNWALMDYGSHLKETVGNLSKRSKHYTKQSTFKGSDRQIRGAILRELAKGPLTEINLYRALNVIEKERIKLQLDALLAENLINKNKTSYLLPL
jgi:A/G-specific adenine glycosylase